MKKSIGLLFLIFILISGFGFLFPERIQGIVNSLSPSYSWAIMNGISIATVILAIIFVVILLTDRKKNSQRGSISVWIIVIFAAILVIGGFYVLNDRGQGSSDTLTDSQRIRKEKTERVVMDSLVASWKATANSFTAKAGESGSFNLPSKIQFISANTMLIYYDDGLVDHMSVVRQENNSFIELKNVGVTSLLRTDVWLDLVKTYGEINYKGSNYQNYDGKGWVNVPENTFIIHEPA